ncbi:hypothetical protein CWB59_12595 [Pseudoalteromonas sp. S326]|uniref:hypothetical protein n=1 Tax=Pseudoalteromonas sp. S326 TaxID=579533 RepID=UPI00110AC217|nr:hypothetical protein [Pseudoalteromonas sp. S326]TMO16751.1 hypothetical protein CWB59_12595 [Pseudoalteromonas sp. S326]
MTTKKSTLTQLSPVGEVFCDGFISNSKAQASKAIQDGAAVNHDAAFANLTKSAAVLAEKNCLDRQVRDALISIGAHILVQAQKEAVAAQDAKAESAKKADKAA